MGWVGFKLQLWERACGRGLDFCAELGGVCGGEAEFCQETRHVGEVVEVHDFHGGVHVAVGHAEAGAGHATALQEDGVGIGARPARVDLKLVGDVFFFGDFFEQGIDARVVGAADADDGPGAEFDVAVFFLVAERGVGGVGHVHDEGDVGLQRVAGHTCAVEAVFLLDGGEGDDARAARLGFASGFGAFFCKEAECFGSTKDAYAVVAAAGGDVFTGETLNSGGVGDGVANTHEFFGVLFGVDADVDEHAVDVGDFFAVVWVLQVDGELAGDSRDGAILAVDGDALAADEGVVHAADALEVDVAFVGDVFDHEADFVSMATEEDARRAARVDDGVAVAPGVAAGFIGECGHIIEPSALDGGFKARGGSSFEELEEEVGGFLSHDF